MEKRVKTQLGTAAFFLEVQWASKRRGEKVKKVTINMIYKKLGITEN